MTKQEIDRIESAIRHIQTAADVDPWAAEIAVEAMRKQIADFGKMPEQTAENAQNVQDEDLISRKAAIADTVHMELFDRDYPVVPVGVLNSLPAAQPQIIRCKDCKHRDKYGCCKYWKGLAMADIPIATDDNDFCSYAKRI